MEVQQSGSSFGGGGIGFVNFTADDHEELMLGVAPSGSSKTKARREREQDELLQLVGLDVRQLKAARLGRV